MTSNKKRIAKNTLLLYFRMLFIMIVNLYTSRIVLNTLGVVDYGINNVVGGIVSMFTFLNGALAASTQRFLNYEMAKKNFEQLQKVFMSSFYVHIFISIVIIVLAETIGLYFFNEKLIIPENRIFAARCVYQFSVVSCVIMILSAPYNASIIAHEKMNAFAYISILEVVLKLLIVYLLVISPADKLILYSFLLLVIQLIIRIIYQIYCNKNFIETKLYWNFDKSMIVKIGSFASWNLIGSMAVIGVTQGLNILLNIFFGPAVNAARAVAVQVQAAINSFAYNFQTAINPQITKSYAVKDFSYMHQLIFSSSKYSFFVLFILSLPVIIETDYILNLWLGEYPIYTIEFLRIILCISLIDATSNALVTSISATGNIKKYQIIIGTILIMVVPLSYIILKIGYLKPEVVFLMHLIINIIALFIRLFFAYNMIQLNIKNYIQQVFVRIILVIVCTIPIPFFLHNYLQPSLLRLGIICFTSTMLNIIVIYIIGLQKTEKKLISTKVKSVLHIK